MTSVSEKFRTFLKEYFTIPRSEEQELEAVADIRKGVNFRGSTLWILICAILIASLGLNVNSTAVIIGAMLISPLMGPIIGMGYSIGAYDFELLKRSFFNFAVATVISILTATLYFAITPLDTAQSEILARTSPTFYDICTALVGGIAGVIAIGAREKGNVVPGVAIATALMPPLCTAGFGFATGNIKYAAGALFLFFINVVFIGTATYLGVVLMGFKKQTNLDRKHKNELYAYIIAIVLIAFCPAVFMTVNIVRQTLYEKSASTFIESEFSVLDNSIVIDKNVSYKDRNIRIVLLGAGISESEELIFKSHLENYGLKDTHLSIVQGEKNEGDIDALKSMILEDFYKNSEEKLVKQQEQIVKLKEELSSYKLFDELLPAISSEMATLFPEISSIALSKSYRIDAASQVRDTVLLTVIGLKEHTAIPDTARIRDWLTVRTGEKRIKIVTE